MGGKERRYYMRGGDRLGEKGGYSCHHGLTSSRLTRRGGGGGVADMPSPC